MGLVSLLFSFNGRINRLQYWAGSIGVCVGVFILSFALSSMMGASLINAKNNPAAILAALASFGLLLGPILLASAWCGLALQVKRFHDRGRSGLWTLLPLLPLTLIMLAIFEGAANNQPLEQVVQSVGNYMLLLWAINIGFFIDLGCLPSQEGPNKYGDPPGAPRTSAPTSPSRAPSGKGEPAPAANSLLGAQSAIDRAIAERARQPQTQPAKAAAPVRAPAPAGAAAATPGFGRRVTR